MLTDPGEKSIEFLLEIEGQAMHSLLGLDKVDDYQ